MGFVNDNFAMRRVIKITSRLLLSNRHTHTHTHLTALSPGLPRWAGTRKEKPIWILLKQETVSGSGISWNICKSAPRSRQITMPTPHNSVFYRPDALPATQPTASKHWRHLLSNRPVVEYSLANLTICAWLLTGIVGSNCDSSSLWPTHGALNAA